MRTTVLATAVATLSMMGATDALARSEKCICTFSTETTSQGQFAIGKCAKASRPGRFVIRSVVKRADNEAEYRRRARLVGQRFNCDLVRTGRSRGADNYSVRNCTR